MVDVAQLVRAPVCGTGGRGFKSRHPPHIYSHRTFGGIFNAFLACLSPTIVGDFLFWASLGQTDTFAYGAFGTQEQGQKVSLYHFALTYKQAAFLKNVRKYYLSLTATHSF